MKNAIIFHGTEGYPEENWFPWLKVELEKRGYQVSVPQFPSPPIVPAKIIEWWEVFKKYTPNEETLLIGHSLGGKFLLRVLEKLDKTIAGAFFISVPIGVQPILNNERDNAFTSNGFNWEKIRQNAKRFEVFHSDNDPYVGIANGQVLADKLGAKFNLIPNAGHFNQAAGYINFPQLLERILYKEKITVTTRSGKLLSKIGIGSFGVGGRGHRDVELTEIRPDDLYIKALGYTLNKGVNFTEISLGYGHGKSLNLFKKALDISSVAREDIFLTHSFYLRDLPSLAVINKDINEFYKLMDTDYADSTLVTQSILLTFGEKPIFNILHKLLKTGRTRYVSLSNSNPEIIKKFYNEFGDKFFAHEGHLSFEVRALQEKGVFADCDSLGVTNIIWRPLGRGNTMKQNWPLLVELSTKYKCSVPQIIINWICHLGYKPMVFATNENHINENVSATDFVMDANDYRRITDFRPPNYRLSLIDWNGVDIDDDIVWIVNNFPDEKDYNN